MLILLSKSLLKCWTLLNFYLYGWIMLNFHVINNVAAHSTAVTGILAHYRRRKPAAAYFLNYNNLIWIVIDNLIYILTDIIMGVSWWNSDNIDKLASSGDILFTSCGIMDENVWTQAFRCKSCHGIWHFKWNFHWSFES